MKSALLRQMARLQGRMKWLLNKKSNELKRIGMLFVAVPLILPVGAVTAAELKSPVSTEPNVTVVATYSDTFVSGQTKTVQFELRPSPRQKVRKIQVPVNPISLVVAEPSLEEKRAWVQKAAAAWGIDWKVLEAVWQVESGKRWQTSVTSYAGARGPCQFMPGTWRTYAQDGNGDGQSNVFDARDCLFGAAKLLSVNGAASGNVTQALLRYNHSISYVNKVLRIADSIVVN